MTPPPLALELLDVAQWAIWFEAPAQALAIPLRFLAEFMTCGTAKDIAVVRRHISPDDFNRALNGVPPGITDAQSWAYGRPARAPACLRMNHSATARLSTQAAPISSARGSSEGKPINMIQGNWVTAWVPAPIPMA
jgi:hypothetical protein